MDPRYLFLKSYALPVVALLIYGFALLIAQPTVMSVEGEVNLNNFFNPFTVGLLALYYVLRRDTVATKVAEFLILLLFLGCSYGIIEETW